MHIGANGTGKSSLFSVFGFLQEAMDANVRTALATLGGSVASMRCAAAMWTTRPAMALPGLQAGQRVCRHQRGHGGEDGSRARAEPEAGYGEHLSREGENLALVIEYLHNNHTHVESRQTEEGRVLLKFQDGAFLSHDADSRRPGWPLTATARNGSETSRNNAPDGGWYITTIGVTACAMPCMLPPSAPA